VTVDGTLTDSPYMLLGTNAGGPAPSFSTANQLTALYAHVDPATNSLYLGIGGNISSGNRIIVFVDSRAGGYTTGNYGGQTGPGGVRGFNAGHQFDAGFTADFAVSIGAFEGNYFVNVTELAGMRGNGDSIDRYFGDANGSADIAGIGTTDATNVSQGIEIRLPFSGTASGATPIASDRQSMQFFALVSGDNPDGFLSNSFLSPAAATQTDNYGTAALNFETLQQDPLSYVWQQIDGRKGWRQLAWPVMGGTVANLAAQNHVQGPNTNFPSGGSNLLFKNSSIGQNFVPAQGLTQTLDATGSVASAISRGFFWYHYDAADFPQGPASDFRPLPYTLRAGGIEHQEDVIAFENGSNVFVLGGNPFSLDFDTQKIVSSGQPVGALVYVWDPDLGTSGQYVAIDRNAPNLADRTVAPMQGMWIPVGSTSPAAGLGGQQITYQQAGRVQTNEPIISLTAAQRVLGFRLDRLTEAGPVAEWVTARLAFVEGATAGSDAFDVSLPPAVDAASDARIAFLDGDTPLGQLSRTFTPEGAVESALALFVAGRPDDATYRLTWPTMEAVPAEWAFTLRDGDTGETVDLRTADHLDFTASPGDWTSRFTVRVAPRSTAGEDAPTLADLGAVTPNPVTVAARVALTVDRPQHVRAELFDALGRSVGVVLDAVVHAPRDLVVDTHMLAPGVYVLRVSADTFAASRRVTVAR
jgi:hypothetical protein